MTRRRTEADVARDEAMEQAEIGTTAVWRAAAWQAIRRVARANKRFTTDDVIRECKATAQEPRAWGPLMRDAVRHNLCIATDKHVPSRMASCHARPKRQYRSLVWRKP